MIHMIRLAIDKCLNLYMTSQIVSHRKYVDFKFSIKMFSSIHLTSTNKQYQIDRLKKHATYANMQNCIFSLLRYPDKIIRFFK